MHDQQTHKPLTKEQFRSQFSEQIELDAAAHKIMRFDQILHGYILYRLLDRIVLMDAVADGHKKGRLQTKIAYFIAPRK